MDFEYLKASDGTGDAALMHITATRLTGSTTIEVDSVSNVPDTFIGTYGDLNAAGFIEPSSKREFTGHLDGSDIIIDNFEPGNADNGNTDGQVVVIRPSTGFANRVAQFIESLTGHDTPASETIAALKAITLPLAYPVGAIFISVDSTNPATTFGFGTWVAFAAGRTLIGVGTSDVAYAAAATGGETNHTLATSEIPSHSHAATNAAEFIQSGGAGGSFPSASGGAWGFRGSTNTQNAGGGGSHNNLPPYIVTYMWKRTA